MSSPVKLLGERKTETRTSSILRFPSLIHPYTIVFPKAERSFCGRENIFETKSAVIDPELIDDANRSVAGYMNNINVLLDNGYDVEAQKHINSMMNYIYGKFNTLSKRQSNTDSKLE